MDGVKIKGDGEMHMTLSSSLLPNLNRQLQFVTYTNTQFHPSTADTGTNKRRVFVSAFYHNSLMFVVTFDLSPHLP